MTITKPTRFVILALMLVMIPCLANAASDSDALQGLGGPLDAKSLNQYAGGSGLVNNSQATVTSILTGNQIGNVGYTGGIVGNNLVGDSGLSTLIANSGNQVSISQSTVVNVFMH